MFTNWFTMLRLFAEGRAGSPKSRCIALSLSICKAGVIPLLECLPDAPGSRWLASLWIALATPPNAPDCCTLIAASLAGSNYRLLTRPRGGFFSSGGWMGILQKRLQIAYMVEKSVFLDTKKVARKGSLTI